MIVQSFCSLHMLMYSELSVLHVSILKAIYQYPEQISIPLNIGPTSGIAVTLKTGRRDVPGSNSGRACRSSRSEFSVVFSETRVNTG